jgi:two-component system response regulator VicR
MKILVADDDRVWAELLKTTFQEEGFDVLTAFDGMQATMHAFQSFPDLIVLDVQMPGGTGLDALRRLKMSTKTVKIPVLVVSGSEDAALPGRLEAMGAAAFVRKPASQREVVQAARALL